MAHWRSHHDHQAGAVLLGAGSGEPGGGGFGRPRSFVYRLPETQVRPATRPGPIFGPYHLATGCPIGSSGVAFARPDRFHLLDMTNKEALEHLGMEVTLTGTLHEATNTVKVTSIKASNQETSDPGRSWPGFHGERRPPLPVTPANRRMSCVYGRARPEPPCFGVNEVRQVSGPGGCVGGCGERRGLQLPLLGRGEFPRYRPRERFGGTSSHSRPASGCSIGFSFEEFFQDSWVTASGQAFRSTARCSGFGC